MESKLILGKYKLLEEIGKGGMGRVYKAEDIRLDRIVAIKELVISDLLEENERLEIVERFRREAQSAAGLNHPNIVTIYDVLEENQRHYIAMEYASGKTLKNKMDENYKFTLDELLDIFIQIAAGLEHAHSKGIIHRDIKPDNIKIVDDNVVKIMDFGIASMERKKDSITQRGSLMGTLGYISPEQLYNSNKVDSRADIFSFGAMLYEFFTKKLPFEGENIAEVIMNIMTLTPILPSKYNINMHPKIENLILKCLDKDPEKRYQKFKEISSELMILKFSENSGELKLSDAVYDTGLLGEVNQLRLTFQEHSSYTTPPN
ncbi:MAG: serine/threonine-protein kinase, partial [Candidatus Sericytochromatia bacterium]